MSMKLFSTLVDQYKKYNEVLEAIPKAQRLKSWLNASLLSFIICLPFLLLIVNLFIYLKLYYFLIGLLNIVVIGFIFLLNYFQQYLLALKFLMIVIVKTILYSLIASSIIWPIAYIIGGLL